MSIKIYKDSAANSIFIEDNNGAQFINSLQATVPVDKVTITDLARQIDIVSDVDHTDFVDENDVQYAGTATEVCDALNAIFQSSGTPSGDAPTITSNTTINLIEGQTLNYELTATFGVGFEWENLPAGVTTVEGNVRKIIGGSNLTAGTYSITARAINYNGTDQKTINVVVSNPSFANSKSVNFNNNDYLGANAGILDGVLGRSTNGVGATDAHTVSVWFKAGTASNASQTILYFGNQDVANQGFLQLKYNGSLNRLDFVYGTNNNNLRLSTPSNSITVGQWHHIMYCYKGGQTGNSSATNDLNSYYAQFPFFLDGVDISSTLIKSNSNFGYTGGIVGQNFRVGRFNNGQNLRNNCRVDELAVWDSDQSANISSIYSVGGAVDLMSLQDEPEHWWRMGDGDTFPFLFDTGVQANCIFQMQNMTSADIVNDVP